MSDTPVFDAVPQLVAAAPRTPITPIMVRAAERPRPWWRGGVEFGAASLPGSYHEENEDSFIPALPAPSRLAVADGVGGGARGRVASQALIERIRQLTPAILARPARLRQWLFDADDAVAAEIARYTDRAGASTFVAALPQWGWRRWRITWVGDCRAYRLRGRGEPQPLTRDDTYGHLGETPPPNAGADDPARMVGNGAVEETNRVVAALRCGEILLLCSDGVHKEVPAGEMAEILRGAESLNARCRKLAAAAHTNGGTDDATVVAVQRHRWFGLGDAVWALVIVALFAGAGLGYFAHFDRVSVRDETPTQARPSAPAKAPKPRPTVPEPSLPHWPVETLPAGEISAPELPLPHLPVETLPAGLPLHLPMEMPPVGRVPPPASKSLPAMQSPPVNRLNSTHHREGKQR
ncbi:MAG: protein phosphatase 2C domain-containing protein [Candidatus Contendobacter sp.]|nr:protein phosphatase 2C domain-containing protein [Candidatus Contendobacter sp.]